MIEPFFTQEDNYKYYMTSIMYITIESIPKIYNVMMHMKPPD